MPLVLLIFRSLKRYFGLYVILAVCGFVNFVALFSQIYEEKIFLLSLEYNLKSLIFVLYI